MLCQFLLYSSDSHTQTYTHTQTHTHTHTPIHSFSPILFSSLKIRIWCLKGTGRKYSCLRVRLPCGCRQLASSFWSFFKDGGLSSFPFASYITGFHNPGCRKQFLNIWLSCLGHQHNPLGLWHSQLSISLSLAGEGGFPSASLVGPPTPRRGPGHSRDKDRGWEPKQTKGSCPSCPAEGEAWLGVWEGSTFRTFKKKPEIQIFLCVKASTFHIFSNEIHDYVTMYHRAPDFFFLHFSNRNIFDIQYRISLKCKTCWFWYI